MSFTEKKKQIIERVSNLPEISGYRYFVEDLLLKTQGLDEYKDFDVAHLLDFFIDQQLKNGELDEAMFTQFILNLPLFQYIFVCSNSQREWIIWQESLNTFLGERTIEDLLFVKRGDPEIISKSIFEWMMKLCEFSDGNVSSQLNSNSSIALKH